MKMNTNKIIFSILLLAIATVSITSCVRKKFDAPQDVANYDPKLPVNASVQDIKNILGSNTTKLINDDLTIAVIVCADDRAGNFYKAIQVQDTTGGIGVKINYSGLYNKYPVGRKLYIKCKGLYVGAYHQFISIGGAPDGSGGLTELSSIQAEKSIIEANYPNAVPVKKLTIAQINNVNTNKQYVGMLIEIADSVQFLQSYLTKPYAEAGVINSATTIEIEDCSNNAVDIRTSGYCKFASTIIPSGRGRLLAIYSRYDNSAQLTLRDTNDVMLSNPVRCGGVIIQPATDITIKDLRNLYTGTSGSVNVSAYKISGTIISSRVDSNIIKGNVVIQDGSGRGIAVYFKQNEVVRLLGDSVVIELDSLSLYGGVLQANSTLSKMRLIASGKTVTPKELTLVDLNTDMTQTFPKDRKYESTLVKILGCTITPRAPSTNTFYSGSSSIDDRKKTITDLTGTIMLYTQPTTLFKITALPLGNVKIVAIASKFSPDNQLQIRNLDDVKP
jgi:hypothetical protein